MSEQDNLTPLAEQLNARFGATLKRVACVRNETTIELAPEDLVAVATALRDEPDFAFRCFTDIAGVDYLGYGQAEWDTTNVTAEGFSRGVEGQATGRFDWEERPQAQQIGARVAPGRRFASVLHLLSLEHNRRIAIRVYCADDALPRVPSVTALWPGANWFEREAFDLFGIVYEGHPDLRRILTDYGFIGHPFRKDFPLIGNVEVRYDAQAGRVIYEPVNSVEPRVLVPRVIRDDSDALSAQTEAADFWRDN